MTGMRPSRCDRTRSLLSQGLDDAISEVERRSVAQHTARCADCRAFEAREPLRDRGAARRLAASRLTPSSSPSGARRRVPRRLVGNVASVAALLVVSVGGWAVGSSVRRSPATARCRRSASHVSGDALRALHVEALRAGELRMLPATPRPANVKPPRLADDT